MKQLTRAFKGIWIDRKIWLSDLSPTEKNLLAEVDSLDDGKGCFASDQYLADFLHISKGRLANILVGLRKRGLIKTISRKDRKRVLKIGKAGSHENVKSHLTKTLDPGYTSYNLDNKVERERAKKRRSVARSVSNNGHAQMFKEDQVSKLSLFTIQLYDVIFRHTEFGLIPGRTKTSWKTPILEEGELRYKKALRDGIAIERMQPAKDFINRNWFKKFCPRPTTMDLFFKKLTSIEEQMEIVGEKEPPREMEKTYEPVIIKKKDGTIIKRW